MMDINELQSFIDVVKWGSFAEVARRSNLTPAAINQRIRRLERHIGVSLVTRSGHTVKPTKEGLRILSESRDILHRINDLSSLALQNSIQGELNIGAFDSAMTGILPRVMARMYDEHPAITFMLTNGYSINLYRKVFDGDLDAAIVIRPDFELPKHFKWIKVREEPLIVLSNTSFPERDAVALIKACPLIAYDRKLAGGALALSYLSQIGVQPRIRCELASVETIALLVSMGLGISIVPDWASSAKISDQLIKIPLEEGCARSRSIGILWNTQTARLPAVHKFLAIAKDICEELERERTDNPPSNGAHRTR